MAIDIGGDKNDNVIGLIGHPCRYTFNLNGMSLQTLIEVSGFMGDCIIYDISYSAPEISRTVETPGSRDGGFVTRSYRQKASIRVTFALRIYDTKNRRTACSMIQAWAANGGTVTTNDRPGQMLKGCICEEFPEITSVRDWTEPLTMTFSSYVFPYWLNETETKLTLNGKSINSTLTVSGSAPLAYVGFTMQPSDSAIQTLDVTVGSTKLKLRSLSVQKSHRLIVDYDDAWNIRIREVENKNGSWVNVASNWNKLGNRTADSSDALTASCAQIFKFAAQTGSNAQKQIDISGGKNNVSVGASASVWITFQVRGAWL